MRNAVMQYRCCIYYTHALFATICLPAGQLLALRPAAGLQAPHAQPPLAEQAE